MSLRRQGASRGPGSGWKREELKAGIEAFRREHGHYPTATEVDAYQYLPSARSIERQFGGLVELRKSLGLGHHDFRTGEHSSQRAHTVNKRSNTIERAVYDFLIGKFGKEFVHREYFFTDDHRTRADFFVYDAGKGFCVDVFYPNSPRNLSGCLNIKLIKYEGLGAYIEYPILFLQMNESISQERLNQLLKAKKKPLGVGQYLMEWRTFQEFCSERKALNVLQGRSLAQKADLKGFQAK